MGLRPHLLHENERFVGPTMPPFEPVAQLTRDVRDIAQRPALSLFFSSPWDAPPNTVVIFLLKTSFLS